MGASHGGGDGHRLDGGTKPRTAEASEPDERVVPFINYSGQVRILIALYWFNGERHVLGRLFHIKLV